MRPRYLPLLLAASDRPGIGIFEGLAVLLYYGLYLRIVGRHLVQGIDHETSPARPSGREGRICTVEDIANGLGGIGSLIEIPDGEGGLPLPVAVQYPQEQRVLVTIGII